MTQDEIKSRFTALLYEGYRSFVVTFDDSTRGTVRTHPVHTSNEDRADWMIFVIEGLIDHYEYVTKKPKKSVVSIFPAVPSNP